MLLGMIECYYLTTEGHGAPPEELKVGYLLDRESQRGNESPTGSSWPRQEPGNMFNSVGFGIHFK